MYNIAIVCFHCRKLRKPFDSGMLPARSSSAHPAYLKFVYQYVLPLPHTLSQWSLESLQSYNLIDSCELFPISFQFVCQDHWPLKVGLNLAILAFSSIFHVFFHLEKNKWKNMPFFRSTFFVAPCLRPMGFADFREIYRDNPKTRRIPSTNKFEKIGHVQMQAAKTVDFTYGHKRSTVSITPAMGSAQAFGWGGEAGQGEREI